MSRGSGHHSQEGKSAETSGSTKALYRSRQARKEDGQDGAHNRQAKRWLGGVTISAAVSLLLLADRGNTFGLGTQNLENIAGDSNSASTRRDSPSRYETWKGVPCALLRKGTVATAADE